MNDRRETIRSRTQSEETLGVVRTATTQTPPTTDNAPLIVERVWIDLSKSISLTASIVLMLILIFVAALSIIEIGARLSVQTFLNTSIVEINNQISESTPSTISFVRSEKEQPSALISQSVVEQLANIEQLKRQRSEYQRVLGALTTLEYVGAEKSNINLSEINRRAAAIEAPIIVFNQKPESLKDPGTQLQVKPDATNNGSGFFFEDLRSTIFDQSNDALLALAVTFCGAIGAVVAGLRTQKFAGLANIALGLAAGFIAFLALKGGKSLFIIQVTTTQLPVNPYASAFAGILVGLFTERVYEVVSKLFDQAADRATGEDTNNTNPQRNSQNDRHPATMIDSGPQQSQTRPKTSSDTATP